jgi:hypothetical protein
MEVRLQDGVELLYLTFMNLVFQPLCCVFILVLHSRIF